MNVSGAEYRNEPYRRREPGDRALVSIGSDAGVWGWPTQTHRRNGRMAFMRYFQLLLPIVVVGLSGCGSDGRLTAREAPTTRTAYVTSARDLTPEQVEPLVILPGDTTTPVQLRALAEARGPGREDWRLTASNDLTQKARLHE
jgi:hypothetical protein